MPNAIGSARRRPPKGIFQARLSAMYEDRGGRRVLVPSESMWAYREAMTPAAVLSRAGLQQDDWDSWIGQYGEDHWILDWLYHVSRPPEGQQLVYPANWANRPYRDSPDRFFVSYEMLAFRKETFRARAIELVGLTSSRVGQWVREYRQVGGFKRWLFARSDRIPGVEIATRSDIRQCRIAWGYTEIERQAGLGHGAYAYWFRTCFPTDSMAAWVLWLYGGPAPSGWYVLPPSTMQRVKARRQYYVRECHQRAGEDAARALDEYIGALRTPNFGPGAVVEGLFVPPASMHRFRNVARRVAAKQLLSRTARRFPAECFAKWMLDWTKPQDHLGIGGLAPVLESNGQSFVDGYGPPGATGPQLPADQGQIGPKAPEAVAERRTAWARETHEKWDRWNTEEGLSHRAIARREKAETGKSFTPDAIRKALKRLRGNGAQSPN